ncbi:MAG: hypothetical protein KatS3mg060_0351 [Dehalococcoidia bacterium]|nr:MAG: hypothetical protein KatS3mg060_0351 [Dehalococcoidia bacterium]
MRRATALIALVAILLVSAPPVDSRPQLKHAPPDNSFWDPGFLGRGLEGNAFLNRVAAYNLTTGLWSALGNGLHSPPLALAADGSALWAGGDFTALCGDPACTAISPPNGIDRVARWDGTASQPLGFGLNGMVATLLADGRTSTSAAASFGVAAIPAVRSPSQPTASTASLAGTLVGRRSAMASGASQRR